MATNQYEIVIKVDEGTQGSSQFAGTQTPSAPTQGGTQGGAQGGQGGQGATLGGKIKSFGKVMAAAGIVSSAKSAINYSISRVEMWSGNQALQDQIKVGTTLANEAVSFGFAAATGPLGLAAWGIGKVTSFAMQAGDFYYNKQQEEYARQLNAERQSEGRYFE